MNFKKLESGRSMVEMLGVLAIIGVLSVGGIGGYSLSMKRHRANVVVDAVSKYAALSYNQCQQKIMDGEVETDSSGFYTGCDSSTNMDAYEKTDLGKIPAGVTRIVHGAVWTNEATGDDSTITYVTFSDQKLCQAVASITGSTCEYSSYSKDYNVYITIKQN